MTEGHKVKFIATNDLFMYDTIIVPENTVFEGYIEKMNEPVVGTNASMIIRISKMILPDKFELPMKGYIYTSNNNLIGRTTRTDSAVLLRCKLDQGKNEKWASIQISRQDLI